MTKRYRDRRDPAKRVFKIVVEHKEHWRGEAFEVWAKDENSARSIVADGIQSGEIIIDYKTPLEDDIIIVTADEINP